MPARSPATFLLLAAALATPAAAAPAARPAKPVPFGLEHAITLASIAGLQWSPDGRRLAFTVNAPDTAENANNSDVWMWDAATGDCRRLTRHAKSDYHPVFSPGGDTLAFLSPRDADEGRPRIWFLPLRGGEPFVFGRYEESVGEMAWSPDGRTIAFTMLDTIPKAVAERRKRKLDSMVEDEPVQWNHLWTIDVATGGKRRLTSGTFNVATPRWSPDSKSIACITNPTGKVDDGNLSDLAVIPAAGGALRRLGVMVEGAFAWSPDSRWLAWAAGTDRAKHVQKSELWVANAAGGVPTSLTLSFDEDAGDPVWSPGSDTLYFHSQQGTSTRVIAVARTGGLARFGLDRQAEAGALVSGPRGAVAWVQSQPAMPPEVWVAPHADAPGRAVSAVHAPLAGLAYGETRVVRWRSSDGVHVEGVLVRPVGAAPGARLKTVALTHGGPYATRDGLGFKTWARVFASRGWQVFMPNFRSSGGYGTAFMLRERSDWGGQDWRDVSTGLDSLVRWGLADPQKLAAAGHSYGGYLTAWAITQTDRFRAAIVSAGAVDLAALWAQSDAHRYRAFEFEGMPWESFEKWRRASPITHVERVNTPTLVMIGRDDARIPYPQAQQLYQSLRFRGVPTQMVSFPREGHPIREPRHRADWWQRQLDWLDRWVK
jgi:dipeptidyl aminopeptidase/acylaminoacyl peptidase